MTVDLEILCIGNELLIGKVVNTNASWLSKRATSLGVNVRRITVAPDEIPEIVKIVREAIARKPEFILTTGGLGPTFDDKTLEGIAKALNRKLTVNEDALAMVKSKYQEFAKTRKIADGEMTPPRIKMATLPERTQPITNPLGTAPGVLIDLEGTVMIVLPGVPREMEAIFELSVAPLLHQAAGEVTFYEISIFANNIMESVLAPLIDAVMHDNPFVYIKSHPKGKENRPHMELHLSKTGKPTENPNAQLNKAAAQLSALIAKAGGTVVLENAQVDF